jgi:hypothetical protein
MNASEAIYRVTGDVNKSTVWYVDSDGNRQIERVNLPWSRKVPAGKDAILYVRAGRDIDDPGVRVSIVVPRPPDADSNVEAQAKQTAVASDRVTVAGLLRIPSDTAHVRYKIENTHQEADTLHRMITGPDGVVSDTYVRPNEIAPDEYPNDADRLQPDTTVSIPAPSTPNLTLTVNRPPEASIGALGFIYARPKGYDQPLLLRHGLLEPQEKTLDLKAHIRTTAGD